MTPYKLFSFCQHVQGRTAGKIDTFNESHHFNFYCSLRKYFLNDLNFSTDNKIKKFIEVCAKYTGNHFDPFQLNSPEYFEIFKEWYKIHSNVGAYYNNIQETFGKIYNFCVDKELATIEEYTKKWGVSHIISGILGDNVAFALGVHKLPLTRPEILAINKKFLKHLPLVAERIARDKKLEKLLADGIEDVKKKLIWRNEKV